MTDSDEIRARPLQFLGREISFIDQAAVCRQEAEQDRLQRESQIQRNLLSLEAGLGNRYSREQVDLNKFTITHQRQTVIVDRLRKLSKQPLGRCGLVFFGTAGSGKDFLLANMLYTAAHQGLSTKWTNGEDLYGRFRDRIDSDAPEHELFTEFTRPQILGISDPTPPNGKMSDWCLSQLGRLIDRRYRAFLPTWITMNGKNKDDCKRILTDRIWGRLTQGAVVFECFWTDFRIGS